MATLRFEDDSVASIAYLTGGSARFPKGDARPHWGRLQRPARQLPAGQRVVAEGCSGKRRLAGPDKGQRDQLQRFVEAVRTGGPMPIPLESLIATTHATCAVDTSLATGQAVTW